MRQIRYFDIVSMRPEPLTAMYTCSVTEPEIEALAKRHMIPIVERRAS